MRTNIRRGWNSREKEIQAKKKSRRKAKFSESWILKKIKIYREPKNPDKNQNLVRSKFQ